MKAVLIFWVGSMLFCSLFTFILPAWDALQARRRSELKQAKRTTTSTTSGMNRAHPIA